MKNNKSFHGILYALSVAVLLPLTYGYCFLAVRLKALLLQWTASNQPVVVEGAFLFLAFAAGLVLCVALRLWKGWRYFPPALLAVSTLLWVALPNSISSVFLGLGCAGVLCSAFALKHLLQTGLLRLSASAQQDSAV